MYVYNKLHVCVAVEGAAVEGAAVLVVVEGVLVVGCPLLWPVPCPCPCLLCDHLLLCPWVAVVVLLLLQAHNNSGKQWCYKYLLD